MTNETRQRLLDLLVLVSCRAIDRYTAGLDFAAYEGDDLNMTRDAVERPLGIIGEALNRAVAL